MGKLVDGQWVTGSIITSNKKGSYDRIPRSFRSTISSEDTTYKPESGRYHLFVGYACPWATRVMIYRSLKGLEDHISFSVVHPDMLENGWTFSKDFDGATGDDLFNFDFLYQVYQKAQSDISTSVTVPVLWDKKSGTIVNNESSEIIRIFNLAFNDLTGNHNDYYPDEYRDEIDEWNDLIYSNVNNGVYKSGFAKNQEAYDAAVTNLFDALDKLDQHLAEKEFLVGNHLTEADLRLIPTLLRFDLVYYVHFKTNVRKISEYKNLYRYTSNLFNIAAIKKNHNFEHIKRHYYYSHETINPYRIVPKGPAEFIPATQKNYLLCHNLRPL